MKNSIKLNKLIIPQEHGSWGFVLEPLLLALCVAFSFNGLFIALSAFFIFLSHQPIKSIVKFGNSNPLKLRWSLAFLLVYLTLALLLLIIPVSSLSMKTFFPFGISILIMLVFLIYELKVKNKNFVIELSAPVAVDFLTLTILLAANWNARTAAAFFLLLLSRSIESAIYVHLNLEKIKGKSPGNFSLHITNIFFAAALSGLVLSNLLPALSLLAFALLLLRSYNVFGSSKPTVKGIGIMEFVYGAAFVVINILGYYLK